MARSHHRKKHKAHVRQFKHSHDVTTSAKSTTRAKLYLVLTIVGALAGLAISYFANVGVIWLVLATLVGGAAGYVIGKKMDSDLEK